jgi:hypothetical protein
MGAIFALSAVASRLSPVGRGRDHLVKPPFPHLVGLRCGGGSLLSFYAGICLALPVSSNARRPAVAYCNPVVAAHTYSTLFGQPYAVS